MVEKRIALAIRAIIIIEDLQLLKLIFLFCAEARGCVCNYKEQKMRPLVANIDMGGIIVGYRSSSVEGAHRIQRRVVWIACNNLSVRSK